MDDADEEIVIFEKNPVTKKKVRSKKSYKMTVVEERVGYKIRLDDQYYSMAAQKQYVINSEKLMKHARETKFQNEK